MYLLTVHPYFLCTFLNSLSFLLFFFSSFVLSIFILLLSLLPLPFPFVHRFPVADDDLFPPPLSHEIANRLRLLDSLSQLLGALLSRLQLRVVERALVFDMLELLSGRHRATRADNQIGRGKLLQRGSVVRSLNELRESVEILDRVELCCFLLAIYIYKVLLWRRFVIEQLKFCDFKRLKRKRTGEMRKKGMSDK